MVKMVKKSKEEKKPNYSIKTASWFQDSMVADEE
jgi:hypothetical protein